LQRLLLLFGRDRGKHLDAHQVELGATDGVLADLQRGLPSRPRSGLLRLFLVDLRDDVPILRLAIAGVFQLRGAVELDQQVPFADDRPRFREADDDQLRRRGSTLGGATRDAGSSHQPGSYWLNEAVEADGRRGWGGRRRCVSVLLGRTCRNGYEGHRCHAGQRDCRQRSGDEHSDPPERDLSSKSGVSKR
jgi:hypothetical protein